VNYTLELVCSGRVSREHNVQLELIDALVENGANPDEAMSAALHHQEVEAMRRLVQHKAKMTLPVAIALKEKDEIKTLISNSSREELQVALTAAAFYGDVDVIKLLVPHQLDFNAWNRDGFHSHSTPLHQAVLSGSVDSVRALVNAGADIRIKDKEYNGSALSWAIYCQQPAVEQFLREHLAQEIVMKLVDQGIIDQSDVSKAIHQIASEIVS
jgi:peptide-methionine (S)-S-oxide reductase